MLLFKQTEALDVRLFKKYMQSFSRDTGTMAFSSGWMAVPAGIIEIKRTYG
jgi:hypothetical protein